MQQKFQHIGIVACSSPGAALCYRTICAESDRRLGACNHPQISMHGHSLGEYVRRLDAKDLQGVAELMLSSAKKLQSAGADFLICPDNTIHQALPFIREELPLPWLHIADAVIEEAQRHGFHRLGIIGTHWLVESEVYQQKLIARGLEWQIPSHPEREETSRIIMQELVNDIFKQDSIRYFQRVIESLRDNGCDAVILGCTEIPLIINETNSSLAVLDSTRLLAKAAVEKALLPDG